MSTVGRNLPRLLLGRKLEGVRVDGDSDATRTRAIPVPLAAVAVEGRPKEDIRFNVKFRAKENGPDTSKESTRRQSVRRPWMQSRGRVRLSGSDRVTEVGSQGSRRQLVLSCK